MKKLLLCAILFLSVILESLSQESGVVALDIPSRNSLKFNKYTINPTFSFVREQNKYITLYNKRQWIDFEDAPLTYLVSYTGRIKENMVSSFLNSDCNKPENLLSSKNPRELI